MRSQAARRLTPDARRAARSLAAVVAIAAVGIAVWLALGGPRRAARAAATARTAAVAVRIDAGNPGRAIPRSFLGLSVEFSSVRRYIGRGAKGDPAFDRVLALLAAPGGGSPALRIGGNSTDSTWWNPGGRRRPRLVTASVGRPWLADLARFTRRTGTGVTLGLNLGLGNPSNASAFARAALGALPPGAVDAFEIGNEPDLYTSAQRFRVGRLVVSRPVRRRRYPLRAYLRELDRYIRAVRVGLPGVPLAAPGFATPAWLRRLRAVLAPRRRVLHAAVAHAYPLLACPGRRRPTIARLLSPAASHGLATGLRPALAAARGAHVPLRITELGSAACGGTHGVSDVFAGALWSTDALFELAAAGVNGVNFHSWTGAYYSPLEVSGSGRPAGVVVHPGYYGMLLFARATGHGARLIHVSHVAEPGLRVWATRDDRGAIHVVVLNESRRVSRALALRIDGGAGQVAEVQRLRAPGLGARFGVTLGGRGFGHRTNSGELRGDDETEHLAPGAGGYRVTVGPAEGALVTLGG